MTKQKAGNLTSSQKRDKSQAVYRNSGSFTRGGNLLNHQIFMFIGAAKWPFVAFEMLHFIVTAIEMFFTMTKFQVRMVFTKWLTDIQLFLGTDPAHPYDLYVRENAVVRLGMGQIATNPYVVESLSKFWFGVISGFFIALILTLIPTYFYVRYAKHRGKTMLGDYHKRGAHLVSAEELKRLIHTSNNEKMVSTAKKLWPNLPYERVKKLDIDLLNSAGFHIPYRVAGIQFPYGFEQTHMMIIGTTGTGKTVVFSDLITQVRQHRHNAVIYDPTGVFVERFFDPKTDIILNPFDKRCPNWSFFNEASSEPELKAAGLALIPDVAGSSDPFWNIAARTLFIEMCKELIYQGKATNKDLVNSLMKADLEKIHEMLTGTIASPLVDPNVARMAESIRAVFNANADSLQSLPDDDGTEPFSIRNWITDEHKEGSILFISTNYTDKDMTKSLITLWYNTALYAQMTRPVTSNLETWFLIDEFGSLHQIPALPNAVQTIRNHGGAVVLGVHSFNNIYQTYGEHGAKNIIGLTRNKLILNVDDPETATECQKIIGDREVREMDESYSISSNQNRDTTTVTARTQIEPLVMPTELMHMPSMQGYLRLANGFPTAKVYLNYKHYIRRADPHIRRNVTIRPRSAWNDVSTTTNAAAATEAGGMETKAQPRDVVQGTEKVFIEQNEQGAGNLTQRSPVDETKRFDEDEQLADKTLADQSKPDRAKDDDSDVEGQSELMSDVGRREPEPEQQNQIDKAQDQTIQLRRLIDRGVLDTEEETTRKHSLKDNDLDLGL